MISFCFSSTAASMFFTYLSVSFWTSSSMVFWVSLGQLTGLLHGLGLIHGVTADVADGDLCLLAHLGDFLGQLLAALLQRGKSSKTFSLVGSDGGSRLGISAHVQILFHGHVQEDMTAFRHLCQTGLDDFMSTDALDALALVEDVAGLRVEQAGDGLQGGGLTGTVGHR